MRCETCGDGDRPGWIRKTFCDQSYDWIICPACNGTGITSCCDGAVGGPDEVTNTGAATEHPARAPIAAMPLRDNAHELSKLLTNVRYWVAHGCSERAVSAIDAALSGRAWEPSEADVGRAHMAFIDALREAGCWERQVRHCEVYDFRAAMRAAIAAMQGGRK